MLRALQFILFLILGSNLFLSGCRSPNYQVQVLKPASESEIQIIVPEAKDDPLIGQALKVHVIFPPEFAGREIQTRINLWGPDLVPADNPKDKPELRWIVEVPESLGLVPLRIFRKEKEPILTVKLGPKLKISGLSPYDPNPEPRGFTEIAQETYPSVGKMERVVTSSFFGLITENAAHCTVSVIGRNLVMTNAHCVRTEEECEKAEFQFSNVWEKGFFGGRIWRTYDCKKIVATSVEYDFTIALTDDDPTRHYPAIPIDLSQRTFRSKQNVLVIANNQTKHMKRCQIRTENHHYMVRARSDKDLAADCFRFHTHEVKCDQKIIPGDSGSPVLDDRGIIVGILWGGTAKAPDQLGYVIPAWAIAREISHQGASDKVSHILSAR